MTIGWWSAWFIWDVVRFGELSVICCYGCSTRKCEKLIIYASSIEHKLSACITTGGHTMVTWGELCYTMMNKMTIDRWLRTAGAQCVSELGSRGRTRFRGVPGSLGISCQSLSLPMRFHNWKANQPMGGNDIGIIRWLYVIEAHGCRFGVIPLRACKAIKALVTKMRIVQLATYRLCCSALSGLNAIQGCSPSRRASCNTP
jgi:hypothetical protein